MLSRRSGRVHLASGLPTLLMSREVPTILLLTVSLYQPYIALGVPRIGAPAVLLQGRSASSLQCALGSEFPSKLALLTSGQVLGLLHHLPTFPPCLMDDAGKAGRQVKAGRPGIDIRPGYRFRGAVLIIYNM